MMLDRLMLDVEGDLDAARSLIGDERDRVVADLADNAGQTRFWLDRPIPQCAGRSGWAAREESSGAVVRGPNSYRTVILAAAGARWDASRLQRAAHGARGTDEREVEAQRRDAPLTVHVAEHEVVLADKLRMIRWRGVLGHSGRAVMAVVDEVRDSLGLVARPYVDEHVRDHIGATGAE